ncbi:MAG TPA: hypothetical protein PKC72_04260 [Chitinophagaceae bacterium]|nr:hypothetical protein [Chitinophagaceae bacterium]
MKSIIYTLLLVLITIQSCTEKKKSISTGKIDTQPGSRQIELINHDSAKVLLQKIKYWSESFNPQTSLGGKIIRVPEVPDSIGKSIKALRQSSNNEFEKYLTLVLLKIYRCHLTCCNQGYELRNRTSAVGIDSIADPLLFEFNLVAKTFDNNKPIEFINSAIAFSWVQENKKLLDYNKLKSEYDKIKKISSDIKKNPNLYNH